MNAKRKAAPKPKRTAKKRERRIRYSVAMSLDGYISGPNGEIDWIVMDPDIDFGSMMDSFDTVLMGRKTFEAARAMGAGGAMPGMRSVVVSRTLKPEDYPDVTIISDDLEKTLNRMCREPGKDIWLFGGGSLFRTLLDARLVHAVEVAIIPVLLGGGTPFLPATEKRAPLRLTFSRIYEKTGTISLEYAVEP
jgi:dihydrofolate reductase